MAKPSVTTIRLDPEAVHALDRLIVGVAATHGHRTARDELMRALAFGVTVPQAFGMLAAYNLHTAGSNGEPTAPDSRNPARA
jgi:hypothetical protein